MALQTKRLEAVCGQAYSATLGLRQANGTAVTTWTSAATLTLSAWQGETYAAAFVPTGAWVSAPSGIFMLSIAAGDTTLVPMGDYLIRLSVDGGPNQPIVTLRLLDTQGTTVLPRMYGSLKGMVRECSWIQEVESLKDSQANNFIPELDQASREAESIAISREIRVLRDQARRHTPVLYVTPIVPTTGYDAGPEWGDSAIPDTTIQGTLSTFADAIDSVGLMTTYPADRGGLVKWTNLYALYLALDDQVGTVPNTDTSIQSLAMKYLKRANILMAGLTLRVDLDAADDQAVGYGVPDYELVY